MDQKVKPDRGETREEDVALRYFEDNVIKSLELPVLESVLEIRTYEGRYITITPEMAFKGGARTVAELARKLRLLDHVRIYAGRDGVHGMDLFTKPLGYEDGDRLESLFYLPH